MWFVVRGHPGEKLVLVIGLVMVLIVVAAVVLVAVIGVGQRGRSIPNAPRGVNDALSRWSTRLTEAEDEAQRSATSRSPR